MIDSQEFTFTGSFYFFSEDYVTNVILPNINKNLDNKLSLYGFLRYIWIWLFITNHSLRHYVHNFGVERFCIDSLLLLHTGVMIGCHTIASRKSRMRWHSLVMIHHHIQILFIKWEDWSRHGMPTWLRCSNHLGFHALINPSLFGTENTLFLDGCVFQWHHINLGMNVILFVVQRVWLCTKLSSWKGRTNRAKNKARILQQEVTNDESLPSTL